MTSKFILSVPEKPDFRNHTFLKFYGEHYHLGLFKTQYQNIYYYGLYGNDPKNAIGVIFYKGWNLYERCFDLKKFLGKDFPNKLGVDKDNWFLTISLHDTFYDLFYMALWTLILKNERIAIFLNENEITEDVKNLLTKIENLTRHSNPLLNRDAIIVIKQLARKERFIALTEKPIDESSFRRL